MFEQMLKEMLIKLIKEDGDINDAIRFILEDQIDRAIKHKIGRMDIWDTIGTDVTREIDEAIDNLTFDINVSRQ